MRNNEAAGESALEHLLLLCHWPGVCTAVPLTFSLPSLQLQVVAQLFPFLALLSQTWLLLLPWKLRGVSHSSHSWHPLTPNFATQTQYTHIVLSNHLELKKIIPSCLWQIFVIKFSDNSICVGATWFFGMYNTKLCIRQKFCILYLGIYRVWWSIFNIEDLTFTRFCTTSELVISKLPTAYLYLDARKKEIASYSLKNYHFVTKWASQ